MVRHIYSLSHLWFLTWLITQKQPPLQHINENGEQWHHVYSKQTVPAYLTVRSNCNAIPNTNSTANPNSNTMAMQNRNSMTKIIADSNSMLVQDSSTTIRLRTFRLRHFVYRHFVYRHFVYYCIPACKTVIHPTSVSANHYFHQFQLLITLWFLFINPTSTATVIIQHNFI